MTISEYQAGVKEAASSMYDEKLAALAMAEECGEILGVIKKKTIYNDMSKFEAKYGMSVKEKICDECGDLLWQLMNVLNQFDLPIEAVIQYNVNKLTDRHGAFTQTASDGGKR